MNLENFLLDWSVFGSLLVSTPVVVALENSLEARV